MEKEYAEYLFKKTQQDYDLIAEEFSRTRSYLPEDIKSLEKYIENGDKILDIGCGNGRLIELLQSKKVEYVGIDNSGKMIEIAKNKYPDYKFLVASAFNLPFPDNYFDKVFSLAVFHHIPSEELRLRLSNEIKRVLKPKGLLILRIWDFWKRKEGWKLFFKHTILRLIGKSKLDFGDVFVSWKDAKGKVLVQRYLHCFRKIELENLIKKSGFKIKESWRAGKDPTTNIYLIAER